MSLLDRVVEQELVGIFGGCVVACSRETAEVGNCDDVSAIVDKEVALGPPFGCGEQNVGEVLGVFGWFGVEVIVENESNAALSGVLFWPSVDRDFCLSKGCVVKQSVLVSEYGSDSVY